MYGTFAGYQAYHVARGNVTAAAQDEEDVTPALVVASDWSDGTYRGQFSGFKTGGRLQEYEWPRTNAYVEEAGGGVDGSPTREYFEADEIPRNQEHAVYELAWRQIQSPGSLDVDYSATDAIKKAAVEGAVSVEFFGAGNVSAAQLSMPIVDKLMAPLLTGQGAGFSSLTGRSVRV